MRAVVDNEEKPAPGRWQWWFVGLAGVLLLTQLLLGLTDGWNIDRTLGVLAAVAIGLSFMLQLREVLRRASSTGHHQKPEQQ